MPDNQVGGCLCGQVRYSFAGEPLLVAICHCRHCQRQSGAPFSVVTGVAQAEFALTGTTKTFMDTGDSGQPVRRVFCPECGSPVISRLGALPEIVFIKAGTLDQPERWRPSLEVFCETRWPWLPAFAAECHLRSNLGGGQ